MILILFCCSVYSPTPQPVGIERLSDLEIFLLRPKQKQLFKIQNVKKVFSLLQCGLCDELQG